MSGPFDTRCRTRPAVHAGRWLALLALALLFAGLLSSCMQPEPRDQHTIGKCFVCDGRGSSSTKSCTACRGLGFIRVNYSYPVIEPRK